jgi:hypothetical protein
MYIVADGGRAEADPHRKSAEEPVLFPHPHQLIDGLAIEQLEVRCLRHVESRRPADQAVKLPGRQTMQRAFPAAAALAALDHIVALLPEPVHFHDGFRRLLQIAVDHCRAAAAAVRQPRHDRRFLAEIAGKTQPAHALIRGGGTPDLRPGAVARTVVDENQFTVDLCVVKQAADSGGRPGNHFFFIEGWYHNR